MNQVSGEFMELFKKRAGIDRRVASEYHDHDIVPWAVEERCVQCGYPASHKVAEDGANPHIHPLTAYVCCNHFWSTCKNTQTTDYATGHCYERRRHGDVPQDSNPVQASS